MRDVSLPVSINISTFFSYQVTPNVHLLTEKVGEDVHKGRLLRQFLFTITQGGIEGVKCEIRATKESDGQFQRLVAVI